VAGVGHTSRAGGGSGYGASPSGAAVTRDPRKEAPRGERLVWFPLRDGCHARPAEGVTQGEARSAVGGDGASLPVYRGP